MAHDWVFKICQPWDRSPPGSWLPIGEVLVCSQAPIFYIATPWCIFFIVILFGFLSNFNFVLELFYLLLSVRDCCAIFIDRGKLFTSLYVKEEGHSKKHIFLSLPIKTSY